MKGPFLFFIEYIGQLLSYGRVGIFIIQCINLFASLILVCFTFRLFHVNNRYLQCALFLPIMYIACFTFEGGNLTEEFSLVPLLSCLFLCLLFFANSENQSSFWQKRFYSYAGIWFGICFGALLMIRITNAALICAIVFTVVVYLIKSRKFRQLTICAGMFLIGLAVSVLPAILFFGARGLLIEMLNNVFVLGFKYSGEKTIVQHIAETILNTRNQRILLVVVPLFVLLQWRGWRERLLALTGSLFTFFAIALGNNYSHYYTLTIPFLILSELSIVDLIHNKQNRKAIIAFILSAAMLASQLPIIRDFQDWVYPRLFLQDSFTTETLIKDISSKIPEKDYRSVFCYNIDPSWYSYTGVDIFPCIKYCGWQNHYISLMPEIYNDFEDTFTACPPAWLVLPKPSGKIPGFIQDPLATDYKLVYENEQYALYQYLKKKC